MLHDLHGEYKRVILRPLAAGDAEWLRQLRNQPQIRMWFNTSKEISQAEQKAWFTQYAASETDFMYIASLKTAPDVPIGAYAHYNYVRSDGMIEAGRLMVDFAHTTERGLGGDIVGCGTKLAFASFPVRKIRAVVFSDNIRSLDCHISSAGFRPVDASARNGRMNTILEVTREEYASFVQAQP